MTEPTQSFNLASARNIACLTIAVPTFLYSAYAFDVLPPGQKLGFVPFLAMFASIITGGAAAGLTAQEFVDFRRASAAEPRPENE